MRKTVRKYQYVFGRNTMEPFYWFFSKFNLISNIHCELLLNIWVCGPRFSENRETALWKSVVAKGKCKGMSRRHEGSENGETKKEHTAAPSQD